MRNHPAPSSSSRPDPKHSPPLPSAVGLAVVAWALSLCVPATGKDRDERPNIVVVLADDLGFSDIGCFGSEIPTPNIDRLAEDGLRFSQFYTCEVCVPARASLLTGCYPHRVGRALSAEPGWTAAGIDKTKNELPPAEGHFDPGSYGRTEPGEPGGLSADRATLAEVLRDAGYATLMSGKWHCGEGEENWPVNRGFERFFGLLEGAANYFDPSKDYLKARTLMLDANVYEVPEEGFYMTDAITEYGVRFLEEQREDDRPFFLYLSYTAPHAPLHAWPEDIRKFEGAFAEGWDVLRRKRYERLVEAGILNEHCGLSPRDDAVNSWRLSQILHQTEKQQRKMEVYAAQIHSMDRGIGKVLDKLRELGVEENTLVMFLSDNGAYGGELDSDLGDLDSSLPPGGENSYESYGRNWANLSSAPFRLYKTWNHEGGIATPVVARWPRAIKDGGTVIHDLAHVIDIMPTMLELAGADYPRTGNGRDAPPMDGKSLAPLLEGGDREGHEYLCWESFGRRAIRKGKWKLVAKDRVWKLYDMHADRAEMHDLAGAFPDKTRDLARTYDDWAKRVGAGVPPSTDE
ncbi:MAG: arylsulfatase [Verrucomicrobiales bacterium]